MAPATYTEALSKRLTPEVFRPVPGRALWLLIYVPIAVACVVVIVYFHLGAFSKFAFSFLIGLAFSLMGVLAHEILHGSVVEARWLRHLLGIVCLAPLNIGPTFWMIWHNTHHAHTQHPQRDPDTWGTLDSMPVDGSMRLLRRFTSPHSLLFPVLLCTGVTMHAAALLLLTQSQMTRRQRVVTLTEFLGLLALWLFLGFWLGWGHWLFLYLVPLLVANLIINLFVITNHFLNPLDDSGDPLAGSLTVTMPRWLGHLFLNFNYHTEHHLLPSMNPKYAPEITRLLKELWPERYQQMPYGQALLAVWRTPRVYYHHIWLIDLSDRTLYPTLGHGLNHGPKPPRLPKSRPFDSQNSD